MSRTNCNHGNHWRQTEGRVFCVLFLFQGKEIYERRRREPNVKMEVRPQGVSLEKTSGKVRDERQQEAKRTIKENAGSRGT